MCVRAQHTGSRHWPHGDAQTPFASVLKISEQYPWFQNFVVIVIPALAVIGLTGGAVITSGAGDREAQQIAATDLALVLRTGSLPISLGPAPFDEGSVALGAA